MIELKDIKKTYKSKKGVDTEALKGINIKFGDKGLCFILGKSGSGKSTLLNILGGLDNYTSGDIIINNKSTKDFKEKDWDAYRNTYMGFVFQEFNLLDNYSVEDNIKLALELQNKKCSADEVAEALKMVELDDVLKRKPNELSGGQKQRIAIARALIKKPEIILADEPTGNLDSETSKQVFNVLKKLARNKLIVVVSHDEEAANTYADRIIRISDGMVVSDSKEYTSATRKELKLVNAKLPFMYSFKMGLGNLLHKKLKLVFSVLLIVLCLICFGLMVSVSSVDIDKEYIRIFEEKGPTEVSVQKYKEKVNYKNLMLDAIKNMGDPFDSVEVDTVDENFVNEVKSKTNMEWDIEYKIKNNFEYLMWNYNTYRGVSDTMYYTGTNAIKVVEYDKELFSPNNLIGNEPVADDEIVISSYIADQIIHNGILAKENKTQEKAESYKPNSYEELINNGYYINFGNMLYVKVSGIIDYNDKLAKYSELKKVKWSTFYDMDYSDEEHSKLSILSYDLDEDFDSLNLSRVYVNKTFIEKIDLKEENKSNSNSKIMLDNKSSDVDVFGYILNDVEVINNNGKEKVTSLSKNEILINTYILNLLTSGDYEKQFQEKMLSDTFIDDVTFINTYIKNNNIINKKVKTAICNDKIYNDSDNFCEYEIVGIVNDNNDYGMIYYNKDVVSKLISKNLEINAVFRKISDVEELKTILKYYPIDGSDVLSSSVYSEDIIYSVVGASEFELIGKYGTIFFLIFAIIILMNFISDSIKFRKKEIGILRAIGCRSKDVIMMFIYECLALMVICLMISFPIISMFVNHLNNLVLEAYKLSMDLMKFGIAQMFGVAAIMIVIVVIASIIPVRKLTKTKPIDTILDR